MALTDRLSAIGDAIREKNGSTDTYTLAEMPDAILAIETGSGGGNSDFDELFALTGDCSYAFHIDPSTKSKNKLNVIVKECEDKITFTNITEAEGTFQGSGVTKVGDINVYAKPAPTTTDGTSNSGSVMDDGGSYKYLNLMNMFNQSSLNELPALNLTTDAYKVFLKGMFSYAPLSNADAPNLDLSTGLTTTQYFYLENMFANSLLTSMGNISCSNSNAKARMDNMFNSCYGLESIGEISIQPLSMKNMYLNCSRLRELPVMTKSVASAINDSYGVENALTNCYSLRTLRYPFCYNEADGKHYSDYIPVNKLGLNFIAGCYSLDEVRKLYNPSSSLSLKSQATYNFSDCYRLKAFTFRNQVNQGIRETVLDFSNHVGYAVLASHILMYNSGITADKEVKDDATYQALKNDPDWFTCNIKYSRYNRTSAVETINSLPGASDSSPCTIKFKGAAGSGTDGGAINTMTEEEIAVATSKHWTVAFI